ncbi:BlaI/MecI/CopY family transcriptional regulator [Singulisphaera sp. PoT]|uniref:BlaI/MecI/CopY family transcriptional regulator n=1 Tax=Singulisphaera sp. PoT TaxID=3411797 RepID=UPI003BF4FDCF
MRGKEDLPPLSQAQLEIMNVIWDRGDATVADVWKTLSAHRKVARNTVLTMLARLEEKGWLLRDAEEHTHRYRAAVPRAATLGTMIEQLVETAFGGSAEGLMMALLHGRGVSQEEADKIRAMIDEADASRRKRS